MVLPGSDQQAAHGSTPRGGPDSFSGESSSVLDTEAEGVLDDLVSAVAQRLGTSAAQLSIVSAQRVWLTAASSDRGSGRHRSDTFCARVAAAGHTLIVPDAPAYPPASRQTRRSPCPVWSASTPAFP